MKKLTTNERSSLQKLSEKYKEYLDEIVKKICDLKSKVCDVQSDIFINFAFVLWNVIIIFSRKVTKKKMMRRVLLQVILMRRVLPVLVLMRRVVLVTLMMVVHQKILPLFINLRELNQTSKQILIL